VRVFAARRRHQAEAGLVQSAPQRDHLHLFAVGLHDMLEHRDEVFLPKRLRQSRQAGIGPAQSDDSVNGQVTKIDESAQKIIIKHGALKTFGMEDGMTMVFHVVDLALLKAVKPGDKVKLVPDRVNGQITVTKIEKIK
jgi:Cu(I)/Ag(I) efflux system periplasmic protein CusF